MTAASSLPPAPRLGNPWIVLAAGGAIMALNLGLRASFGMFIPPMQADLSTAQPETWSMGVFGLAFAIQNLMWGAFSILGGMLVDRWGTARTLAMGIVLLVIGTVLMVDATSPLLLHLTVGVVIGLGAGMTSNSVILGVVGRAFPAERRSQALGITSAVGSSGQVLFAPLAPMLIEWLSWQDALYTYAGFAALALPLTLVLSGNARSQGAATGQSLRAALGEALGERSFVLLTLGFFVCGFHIALFLTHMPKLVALCGLPPSVSGTSLALVGLFNIAGTLLSGWAGARLPKPMVLSAIYAARALVMVLFILAPKTEAVFLVFSATMGILWLSTVAPTGGTIAALFGTGYMATLFGISMFSHQIGAFIGAWAGGVLFDLTGSYDIVWAISAGLGLAAALLNLGVTETRRPASAAF